MKQQRKEAQKLKEQTRKDVFITYKHLFDSGNGGKVLHDLKARLNYGKTVFHQDSATHYFEIGRQSVINEIMAIISEELK